MSSVHPSVTQYRDFTFWVHLNVILLRSSLYIVLLWKLGQTGVYKVEYSPPPVVGGGVIEQKGDEGKNQMLEKEKKKSCEDLSLLVVPKDEI